MIVLIILGLAFCQTLSREDVYAAEIVAYLNDQAYGDFDHRLIIPKNCKATLDMQGRIFDRRLSRTNDWAANGELICIRKGTITAKKKGSCKIYVFTQNGLCKIIKVRVK